MRNVRFAFPRVRSLKGGATNYTNYGNRHELFVIIRAIGVIRGPGPSLSNLVPLLIILRIKKFDFSGIRKYNCGLN